MLTAFTYKLNPSKNQSSLMGEWLNMLRGLYNFVLKERIEAYEQAKAPTMGDSCRLDNRGECCPLTCSVSKNAIYGSPWTKDGKRRSALAQQDACLPELKAARPWYKRVNADVLQMLLRQLDTAFANFFKHNRGYPRFKRHSNFRSFSYKPGQVKIRGSRVYLPRIGWMRFFNSRSVSARFSIRTVTVRRKADGWYISVKLEDKTVPDVPTKHPDEVKNAIGVDLGIRKLAALSTGEMIPNPQFNKQVERQRRIRQRRASRKKLGSKNRRQAYQQLARLEQKVERRRTDYQWKVANKLVRVADCIIFEDLNIRAMTARCKPKKNEAGRYLHNGQAAKSGLNRVILDAAWGEQIQKTKAVAAKSGSIVWQINPRKSSQECRMCGYVSSDNRDGEKFLCESCGHLDDADGNASNIILMRGCAELGIRVGRVPPEFTPLELSLALAGEPGNPEQLSLFQRRGA